MARPNTLYSTAFYTRGVEETFRSCKAVVPLVLDLLGPRSVIDVGCGNGQWLAAFQRHGVTDIRGLDGDYLPRELLAISSELFTACDLADELRADRTYDLAVSLEVAEHLPAARAAGFVADLTRLAPAVLFSAAIPFQGGTHHVNEQWQGYWADLFAQHGYRPVDAVRPAIWDNEDVISHYRQNIILYVRDDVLAQAGRLREVADRTRGMPLSVVHPSFYLRDANPANDSFRVTAWRLRGATRRMLGRKLRRWLGRSGDGPDVLPARPPAIEG